MSADSVPGAVGLPAYIHPLTRLLGNSTEPEAIPTTVTAASDSSSALTVFPSLEEGQAESYHI